MCVVYVFTCLLCCCFVCQESTHENDGNEDRTTAVGARSHHQHRQFADRHSAASANTSNTWHDFSRPITGQSSWERELTHRGSCSCHVVTQPNSGATPSCILLRESRAKIFCANFSPQRSARIRTEPLALCVRATTPAWRHYIRPVCKQCLAMCVMFFLAMWKYKDFVVVLVVCFVCRDWSELSFSIKIIIIKNLNIVSLLLDHGYVFVVHWTLFLFDFSIVLFSSLSNPFFKKIYIFNLLV